jgi:positive regulator of sigma E activity
MAWLPIIIVLGIIALAVIITQSELMVLVLAFALVALGAIFAATHFMNRAADSAESSGKNK